MWGSPISGASMNPARTSGPDLVGAKFTDYGVYVAGGQELRSRLASRSCFAGTAANGPAAINDPFARGDP